MKKPSRIYLDNPATSWPKPPEVTCAMLNFMKNIGANPGRSAHSSSIDAARIIYATREAIARLFNAPDPLSVIFSHNVTDALNLVLHGLLHPGDHVVTTSMEHNSVMRPLRMLEESGVQVTVVPCNMDGTLDPQRIEDSVRPNTSLAMINHASNVCGTILPIAAVGEIARRRGFLMAVDAAQSAGAFPLDMQASEIDLLAFTGHKSLYGPTGTGGVIIGERVDPRRLRPIRQGGTGSHSEFERQPEFLPDRFESGTPNSVGLAGLNAGVRWILQNGIDSIHAQQQDLCQRMLNGLNAIPGVRVYGTGRADTSTAVVSFNIHHIEPSEVGLQLDENYGIQCRVGLHCAPSAHRTLGTFPQGTVRFGLGVFNTLEDVNAALNAVSNLSRRAQP